MENKKLENLRLEIANLVTKYSEEKYKPTSFVGGETVIPPSGKLMGEEELQNMVAASLDGWLTTCLLYTSPSPRDLSTSRMPSSA